MAGYVTMTGDIGAEVYVLAAKEDHIAGIVNPPSPKAAHWTNDALPPDPKEWMAGAVRREQSWWEDWAAWIGERLGERRPPPPTGAGATGPSAPPPGSTSMRSEER